MLIRQAPDLRWSDVTPKEHYLQRREFMRAAAVPLIAGGAGLLAGRELDARQGKAAKLDFRKSPLSATDEELTPYDDVTTYNNFYEFGVDKDAPARNAGSLRTRPSRNASTGCAASKPGPWSSPGSASRWPRF
jgi:sulfoxide reductase catalytic subunit YedY